MKSTGTDSVESVAMKFHPIKLISETHQALFRFSNSEMDVKKIIKHLNLLTNLVTFNFVLRKTTTTKNAADVPLYK